jgi:hypothetical protein
MWVIVRFVLSTITTSLTLQRTRTVVVRRKQKRIPAAFCPEVGVPCLMAGMDYEIISEGCLRFLHSGIALA